MPNARINNSVAQVGIKKTPLNVRVSSYQSGVNTRGGTIPTGTPLGLLLALTYAADTVLAPVFFSDYRPNVRIK